MSAGFRHERAPVLATYAALVYAFLYFPIIVLVVYSFNGSGVGGFPPADWTTSWYTQLFRDSELWDAVLNSMIVAAVAVAISLAWACQPRLRSTALSSPAKPCSAGLYFFR